MGDRDAVANACGAHRLARLEDVEQESAILFGGKWEPVHELGEHAALRRAVDVVKDPALAEQHGQRRHLVGRTMGDVEQGRETPASRASMAHSQSSIGLRYSRSLTECAGKRPLVDPPADGSFVDAEVARCLAERELHGLTALR